MKLFLLYNPHAARKRATKLWPEIKQTLDARGIDYEIVFTEAPGHGEETIAQLDFSRYDALVAAGGDGTVYELVNGWFRNPASQRPPVGILPIGTGNAFVRDLDLKTGQWQQALELILAGKTEMVDVGCYSEQGSKRYFLNVLGLGFVTAVGQTAAKLKIIGNLSYTVGVFHRLIKLDTYSLTLGIAEGEREVEVLFLEISNSRYTSNFLMAPNASLTDGLLDVTILKPMSRRQLIANFPKIFTGEHLSLPEVEAFTTSQLRISTPAPLLLSPDGELTGHTPIEVSCIPRVLPVFHP